MERAHCEGRVCVGSGFIDAVGVATGAAVVGAVVGISVVITGVGVGVGAGWGVNVVHPAETRRAMTRRNDPRMSFLFIQKIRLNSIYVFVLADYGMHRNPQSRSAV
jgi:type IV secretory pathway TrbD component